MSNRVDYYFRQRVSESELDLGFTYLEQALWNKAIDADYFGAAIGLLIAPQGSPNLTVTASAGSAYDQAGRRINLPTTQNVNCAADVNGVSTAVAGGGNEKWVSIFAGFTRLITDPRTDGNSLTVYFERAESFELRVVQGAESAIGVASRPVLDGARILLADVRLVNGQTSIVAGDISITRRQDRFVYLGALSSLRAGTSKAAAIALATKYDNHIGGLADKHAATQLDYAGGPTWADAVTNPATSVEAQLDKIITDLRSTTGDVKLGAPARSYTGKHTLNLSAGSVGSQLTQLQQSIANIPFRRTHGRNARSVAPLVVAFGATETATLFSEAFVSGDNLLVGDIVEVDWSFDAAPNASVARYFASQFVAIPGDASPTVNGQLLRDKTYPLGTDKRAHSGTDFYVVQYNAIAWTFRLDVSGEAGSPITVETGATFRLRVIRP